MNRLHILFHAPLKPPDHPVPSGDRAMARNLIRILEKAGHRVSVATDLRTSLRGPGALPALKRRARDEISRLIKAHAAHSGARPDLWFTYHNYYRAPDLIGPDCSRSLGIPYMLAEASHSVRRATGEWAVAHRAAEYATLRADAHLCLTSIDRVGLSECVPEHRLFDFPPFIDVSAFADFAGQDARQDAGADRDDLALVTVGMMRARAKLESYRAIAAALVHLPEAGWQLRIVGDGPERAAVEALFAPFGPRVVFAGALPHERVFAALARADAFLWPGRDEAYGLVYLEAQAAGLPVLAEAYAAHRAVMRPDVTALVTPTGHPRALAMSVRAMMRDRGLVRRMGTAARAFVLGSRGDAAAMPRLERALAAVTAQKRQVQKRQAPGPIVVDCALDWPETRRALEETRNAGERARFWLRDDDAVMPTAALERLFALRARADVPMVLASIPAYTTPALAEAVRAHGGVMVAPHGFSHADLAATGEKRSEFPPGRPRREVIESIRSGWRRIAELFGDRALPLFVPPWNRLAPEHLGALPVAGLAGLSVFGWPKTGPTNGLIPRPTHLDIMRWGGDRGGRGMAGLDAELAGHIRTQREIANAVPIGLLTHHLVHDATAWSTLESLLDLLSGHPVVDFPAASLGR